MNWNVLEYIIFCIFCYICYLVGINKGIQKQKLKGDRELLENNKARNPYVVSMTIPTDSKMFLDIQQAISTDTTFEIQQEYKEREELHTFSGCRILRITHPKNYQEAKIDMEVDSLLVRKIV